MSPRVDAGGLAVELRRKVRQKRRSCRVQVHQRWCWRVTKKRWMHTSGLWKWQRGVTERDGGERVECK